MRRLVFLALAALFAFAFWSQAADSTEERIWKHRNLGKAFYENPTTQVQAVDEFKKALDLAPTSRREQLNYGLALLRGGKTKEGVDQLEKVQKQHPDLPHTYFNLGIVYKKDGDFEKAQPQFERMVKLAPDEPISHYNLGVLLRQANKLNEAIAEFQRAIALNGNLAAPHFQLYNVYRALGRREDMARELKLFQDLKKAQEGSATPEDMEWSDYAEIYDPIDVAPETLVAPVYDRYPLAQPGAEHAIRAGNDDIVVYSARSAPAIYRSGKLLNTIPGVTTGIRQIIAGDYDNDGAMDLCILTAQGAVLYNNKIRRVEVASGDFQAAVWLDFDHDYDLDLILLGTGAPKLMRNQGTAGFADRTADFPFVKGAKATSARAFRMVPDTKSFDLVVTYADRNAVLYRDKLAGKYEAEDLAGVPAGTSLRAVADVNRDSYLDLVATDGSVFLNRAAAKRMEKAAANQTWQPDVWIDKQQLAVRRAPANWLRVALTGVKNLKLSQGAEVEVKAGALYQKQVYDGSPLLFDLGSRKAAETVRISWANGLIQNETNQPVGKTHLYKEAQRLSGSCPLIWTWNGTGFQFITDVLGVAPLGASNGDGTFFPVDHDEFIQIPAEALREVDGKYEIRITEELSEVAYLDLLQLEAIDHPSSEEIYTNEKWKSQPFPEERLFGVKKRVYPRKARDDKGRDVLARVLRSDKTHPDEFKRTTGGVAELHALELDFGPAIAANKNEAVLILHGWVDWADGSTFLAAAQESKTGLIPPYLQVRDAQGRWQTVIEDMGMPDGKPKTIAVDLTGKFLTTTNREVRIVTNLCVYWDEIFLSESNRAPQQIRRNVIPSASASLRFRGFSANLVHPERKQPEQFFYDNPSPTSLWNPTPGRYTRYGDVLELVQSVDDRFVIMGSGDEVRLLFDGSKLPPLPQGWRRDFLLKVDGWAKDRDANTAFSQTVEPLPFHGMSQYPFSTSERFPEDVIHRDFQQRYNVRPALRLIRPLLDGNGVGR